MDVIRTAVSMLGLYDPEKGDAREANYQRCLSLTAKVGVIAAYFHRARQGKPLLPVRQVEGIVGLAAQNGILWRIGAWLGLAVLPLPFLLAGKSAHFPVARALGFYFGLCLLAPLAGAFPVPIMGFGLSPVIGYFIALGWLVAREGRAGN